MAAASTELNLLLTAKDSASKDLNKLKGNVKGLGSALGDVSKIAAGFLAGSVIQSGIGKLTGFLGDSVDAAKESIQAQTQLAAVLKSTGGAAGLTMQQLTDMSAALEKQSLFEDEAIDGAESLLLTFTNIGKNVFPQATQTVLDMSQALGQDLKSSSVQLGKALNDPIKGITALSRVGVSFTEQQKKQIEAMQKAGNIAGAQKLILAELNKEFGGSAKAASDAAGSAEVYKDRMNDLKEEIGAKLLPLQLKWQELQAKVIGFISSSALPALSRLIGAVQDLGRYLSSVITDGDSMNDWLTHIPGFAQPAAKALGELVVWFRELPLALQVLINPIAGVALNLDVFKGKALDVIAGVKDLQRLFLLGFNGGKIGGEFTFLEQAAFDLGVVWKQNLIPAFNDAKEAVRLFLLVIQGGQVGGQFSSLQQSAIDLGVSMRKMWVEDIKPALTDLQLLAAQVVQFIRDNWPAIKDAAEIVAKLWASHIRGMVVTTMNLLDAVANVVQLITALAHGDWKKAWDELKQVAMNVFESMPTAMSVIGYDLVQGLINGIIAKAKDLPGVIKEWITDKVPDFVKNAFDSHSPSRVMHKIGEDVSEGLARGIADRAGTLLPPLLQGISATVQNAMAEITGGAGGHTRAENLLDYLRQMNVATDAQRMAQKSQIAAAAKELGYTMFEDASVAIPGTVAYDANHGNLRSYAVGTPFVPNDGPAYLHRGEAVVPAAQNRGGAPVINVMGSILSERDLIRVLRDALASGALPELRGAL